MSALPLAHAGHWLMGLGFAGAPLTVIGGIVVLAWRERRRESHERRSAAGIAQPR